MKVKIDVEITPEEMRKLFGLPDFTPVQDVIMQRIQDQVEAGLSGKLMGQLVQAAISGGTQSFEAYQKLMKAMMGNKMGNKAASGKEEEESSK